MAVSKVEGWFPGDPASRLANGLRRTLGAGVATMPRTARSLYSGFVLGDDREEPPEVADDFKASGLSHLLVVSGENVAFVLALFAPVLSRLGLRSRLLFGLAVLCVFGVLTRWEPSVMRAEAMAAIALIAATAGRPASTLRVLALAVTTVLVIDPLLVGSVGFLLSVGACAGIALLAGPIVRILPGPRPLAAAAAVTIAAQVGVAPILVPVFGGLPVASLPANLLALPAAGPVTIYGIFAGLPAGILGPPVATALHLPTHAMVWWVATVARLSARAPLGQLTLGPLVALAAAAGLAAWARARGSPQVMALGVTGVGAVLVVAALPALRPAGAMGDEVAGGARLWRGGGATLLVVDGAPSPQQLLTSLRTSNVGRLDVLVVVRPGAMAATAIAPVAARYPPRLLLAPEAERLQNAVVPAVGARYNVGEFRITVTSLKPRLAVEVRSARAPPAGP
jgi:ComEC/Rec2-related protein